MNNTITGRTSCHGVNKNDSPLKRRTLVEYGFNKYKNMINRKNCDIDMPLIRPSYVVHGYNCERVVQTSDDLLSFLTEFDPKLKIMNLDDWAIVVWYRGNHIVHGHWLSDYNINGDIHCCMMCISYYPRMRGGAARLDFEPGLSHSVLIERYIMRNRETDIVDLSHMSLQAGEDSPPFLDATFMKFVDGHVQNYAKNGKLDKDIEWVASQIDNMFHVAYWFRKCNNFADYEKLVQLAYKLIVGRNIYGDVIKYMMKDDDVVQADNFGDFLAMLRQGLTGVQKIEQAPLVKKVVSMYSFLLVHGFLNKFGLEINDQDYTKLEQKALYVSYSSKKDMWMCVLDTTLFICEKLYELKQTGDISCFMHNTTEYSKWLKEADRILALAPFTSNLGAHGTTYFSFVSDLSDLIEKGTAYMKYTSANDGAECSLLKKKLYALQLLKNTDITRRASQKERSAPFGALIYGGSSVAKSSFCKMMFYYYASLHKLENEDHFRYVRNPADEYWSNFDSSKWCIQMDDIAFLLPKNSSGPDPTLMEMLNVVNNVPYVPPQAALEDKGKTPVLSELVLATSNAQDLNARDYFWCPLAVQRRLPFVVEIKPKGDYLHDNGKFIDPSKLNLACDDYPDYWLIQMYEIEPFCDGQRDHARLVKGKSFTSTSEFLKFFGEATMEHKGNQARGSLCDITMRDVGVCPICLYSAKHCQCVVQAGVKQSIKDCFSWSISYTLSCLFSLYWIGSWFLWTHRQLARLRICRYMIVTYALPWYPAANQMQVLGQIHDSLVKNKRLKYCLMFVAGLGIAAATHMRFSAKVEEMKSSEAKPSKDSKESEEKSKDEKETKPVPQQSIITEAVKDNLKDVKLPGNTRPQLEVKSFGGAQWIRVEDVNSGKSKLFIEDCEYDEPNFTLQGNSFGTVETQLEKETSQNVWYNDTIELTKFDLPISSQSLVGATDDALRTMFERNCVHINVVGHQGNLRHNTRVGAVFLKGHYCLTNNHAFKEGCTHYSVELIQSSSSQGLNSNLEFTLKHQAIFRNVEKDVCVFEVLSLPPFKDITKFWHTSPIYRTNLLVLQRRSTGRVEKRTVHNVNYLERCRVESMDVKIPVYFGVGDCETALGDCGALAIAKTPRGCVLVGIHMLGHGRTCGINAVSLEDINHLIEESASVYPNVVVQGGGEPSFTCESRTHILGAPHHRSITRYLQDGTANVYGSFQGFRPRPRSKVCPTPLSEVFLEHYNVPVGYGKPAMAGWKPWRLNVEQMVQPYVHYDKDCLNHCVEAYLNDIIQGLPDGWQRELVILSREASINGLPGVKYIDKINCNTSMGFPWNTSKKGFLAASPSERYPEGKTFDPEVWEKVEAIEAKYEQGVRAYPIFTGHLKDEATALAKCAAQKTRVFTGAPIDWSLVVRSRLLSFVRLLQKNKFVFEAGPGTVCQSSEWGNIREYLTVFGEDRMVAGDYGKFDKRMISDFILAAFRIIADIHKIAGFTDEEVRVIMCIAEDTAFPVVNMNGDLIEFYGTNPSGHPLTVIINSLVNSLYMRYCYTMLNPKKECFSFKKNVHLFTYGDDNIMGVIGKCNWFNHTAIQETLATIGVEYTMADKKAESIPFIDIKDCSFLKRTWRFDEDVQDWLAPLEEDSIIKSLTMWVPSGSIDKYAQMVDVISSANSEYFFYGKKKFEKEHAFLETLLDKEPFKFYLTKGKFPNWHELVERFKSACEDIAPLPEGLGRSQEDENGHKKV